MSIADQILIAKADYDAVYEAGYAKGKSEGGDTTAAYEQGVADGKQAEYDDFWDAVQVNGTRKAYAFVFAGAGWTEKNFKPKYDMRVANGQYMFRYSQINADLVEILEKQGVVLDFSGVTNTDRIFADAKFTRIGVVDFSNVTTINTTFANTSTLVTVDKIILKDDGSNTFSTAFTNLNALENITFEGVIGKNGISFQWSNKLTHDSLVSIINALQDKTGDTSGTVWKVTIGSTNYAKLTTEDLKNIQAKGWIFA